MPYTVNDFICNTFRAAYCNETVVDHQGKPFVVREVWVSSDMDGLRIDLFDRQPNDNAANWPHLNRPYPFEDRRVLSLADTDCLPSIVNLAWDKKAKVWTPIPPRRERDDKAHPLNHP